MSRWPSSPAARCTLPGLTKRGIGDALAESQASLPAVARPLGAAGERIQDGKTGFLAKDDNAFAEMAIRLLDDQATHARMSEHAREIGGTPWSTVAGQFEALTR